MATLTDTVFWTADMVRALPDDGKRHETIHGEILVSPAPRMWHFVVVRRLRVCLEAYLDHTPAGNVVDHPADISWGPDVLVQPDLFVAPLAEMRTLDWSSVQHLLLVAEVLSPSTMRWDRVVKRKLYQRVGVPVYWVVDADAHLVECWTPEATAPIIERERLIWHPAGADAPCVIELAEIFGPV